MKKILFSLILILAFSFRAYSHCEIPCGIYDDEMRVKLIKEHMTTVEKSINEILKIQKNQPVNYNQLVRWVTNKEEHANKIMDIVFQYFMTQRIKPAKTDEQEMKNKKMLVKLHAIIFNAMKLKQTVDTKYLKEIDSALHDFNHLYFKKHDHKH